MKHVRATSVVLMLALLCALPPSAFAQTSAAID